MKPFGGDPRIKKRPPNMRTTFKLSPKNVRTVTQYAKGAGLTPTEFLNRYLEDSMPVIFELRFEDHLTKLENIFERAHQFLSIAGIIRLGTDRKRVA
jgi:hypothetical protein